VCKRVRVFISRLSINTFPLSVKNRVAITTNGGKTSKINLGGIVFETV
jgi:hypothetical protein